MRRPRPERVRCRVLVEAALAEQAGAHGAGPVAATALAVRLLDYVPAVRDEDRSALSGCLKPGHATAVLSLLLAGRGRRHAIASLVVVQEEMNETGDRGVQVTIFAAKVDIHQDVSLYMKQLSDDLPRG
ncbi:hypothetical protein [Kineosporia sp. NBRC 101731]|uniref:hypothetical protein n=1 Tax=Kineosporia sp. NBRC 101731 TaxID=3032199 RepID=UPI0024A0EA57|nr:hypothetical protein [Kineosporia sp. NBRC 101731]GLY30866.1 hypothetical protein Kisp02_42310 [Kineosporia sp. NBRC 101731]